MENKPVVTKKIRILFKFPLYFLVFIGVLLTIYSIVIHNINKFHYDENNGNSPVSQRKFPYPYRAAIAISSDICGTKSFDEFLEIHKFINTRQETSMGKGIGLEIGNSFLFYEPGAISYFSKDSKIADAIAHYIRTGSIDVIHSYGKKADFTRDDAVMALGELRKKEFRLDVWVDHERTIDNLGDDVTIGLGDHPESEAYHTDLTLDYGIKFAWMGRVTMITGQSSPLTLKAFTNIFDNDHPLRSIINFSKEFAKNILGIIGSQRYALHRANELVKITTLDDGQKMYEFMRFDNYWQGVSTGASSSRLHYVISRKTLNDLKEREGFMIVYTHLDSSLNKRGEQLIPAKAQEALQNLAFEYRAGNIYVTTTSKLLNYYINHRYLHWTYENRDGEISIHIHTIKDPIFGTRIPKEQELQGITFYVPDSRKTRVFVNGKAIEDIQKNSLDNTGRESVTIPFRSISSEELLASKGDSKKKF